MGGSQEKGLSSFPGFPSMALRISLHYVMTDRHVPGGMTSPKAKD
jgi:hypothetical protein